MNNTLVTNTLAAAVLALTSTTVLAGRAASPEERAGIEVALPAQGYSSWGKIEWDDGRWEVDNAVDTDGKTYDLKLDRNFTVRESELDD
jgi:Peptidase propeptide and YPEB domain